MSRLTEEFVIGDHKYRTNQFTGTKGTQLWAKIVKIIGKPLASLEGSISLDEEVDEVAVFLKISGLLLDNIPEDSYDSLVKDVLSNTEVEKENGFMQIKNCFDTHFQGKIAHMHKVLFKVLEVNYSDFFSEFAGLMQQGLAKTKQKSGLQKIS